MKPQKIAWALFLFIVAIMLTLFLTATSCHSRKPNADNSFKYVDTVEFSKPLTDSILTPALDTLYGYTVTRANKKSLKIKPVKQIANFSALSNNSIWHVSSSDYDILGPDTTRPLYHFMLGLKGDTTIKFAFLSEERDYINIERKDGGLDTVWSYETVFPGRGSAIIYLKNGGELKIFADSKGGIKLYQHLFNKQVYGIGMGMIMEKGSTENTDLMPMPIEITKYPPLRFSKEFGYYTYVTEKGMSAYDIFGINKNNVAWPNKNFAYDTLKSDDKYISMMNMDGTWSLVPPNLPNADSVYFNARDRRIDLLEKRIEELEKWKGKIMPGGSVTPGQINFKTK